MSKHTKPIKINEKYGCFTIIEEPFRKKYSRTTGIFAKCRCDCGEIMIKRNTCLYRFPKFCDRTCKIYLNDMSVSEGRRILPINEYFGELFILDIYYKKVKDQRLQFVKCQCSCGNNFEHRASLVKNKYKTHCGCKTAELIEKNNRKGSLALDGLKICAYCKIEKDMKEYDKNYTTKDELSSICKSCRREKQLYFQYGITMEDFNNLLQKQEYKCAVCKKDFKDDNGLANIDHCHKTNRIRGLLCKTCNLGIGALKDDLNNLKNAVLYLEMPPDDNCLFKKRIRKWSRNLKDH